MNNRAERIAGEIRKELLDIIRNQVKDPRLDTFISITDIEVSRDISYATIYISKLGSEEDRKETLDALNKASGYFRTELSQRLKIRSVPELQFKLDDSLAYGAKIDSIINEINRNEP